MNDKELKPYKAKYGIVPVVTRNGRKARILCADSKLETSFPVVAAFVCEEDNKEVFSMFRRNGKYTSGSAPNRYDLFLDPDAPKTTTRYQNIYRRANGHLVSGALCKTKERADNEKRTFNGTWLCQQTIIILK